MCEIYIFFINISIVLQYSLTELGLTFSCYRYVCEILGGQKYVSCSAVRPDLWHLSRVMENSDDDMIYND